MERGIQPVIPSPAQVALALIVLKSLPSNLSVEDYIGQIRSCIVNRPRKEPIKTQNYIDGTTFWKDAYERAEIENTRLEDKLFELQQTLEKSRSLSPQVSSRVKRVMHRNEQARANTQSKRRKVDVETHETPRKRELPQDIKLLCSENRSLLRIFYELHTAIRKRQSNPSELCRSIKVASQIARRWLECSGEAKSDHIDQQFGRVVPHKGFAALIGLWRALLEATRRVETLKPDIGYGSIPDIVSLFQTLLGQLQQCCLNEADRQIKARKRKTKSSSRRQEMGEDKKILAEFKVLCSTIVNASCEMLIALELTAKAHLSIYEGILCCILDHIGSSMSLLVFVSSETTIEKQMGILPPTGLGDVAHIDSDTALLTSQLAGPFLLPILQRAMAIAANLDARQQCSLLKLKSVNTSEAGSLTEKVRQMLQSTLLRGVYGDEDDAFGSTLRRCDSPVELDMSNLLESAEREEDKSEWFIGQVWEHLGWDILTAE